MQVAQESSSRGIYPEEGRCLVEKEERGSLQDECEPLGGLPCEGGESPEEGGDALDLPAHQQPAEPTGEPSGKGANCLLRNSS